MNEAQAAELGLGTIIPDPTEVEQVRQVAAGVRVSTYRMPTEKVAHQKLVLDAEHYDLHEPIDEDKEEERRAVCKEAKTRFTPSVPKVRQVWVTCSGCGRTGGVAMDSMTLQMYLAIRGDIIGDGKALGPDTIYKALLENNAQIRRGERKIFVPGQQTQSQS